MDGLGKILAVCLILGIWIVCICLVAKGVWDWFTGKNEPQKGKKSPKWREAFRLALVILPVMFFSSCIAMLDNASLQTGNEMMTALFISTSKFVVKASMLGGVLTVAVIVLVVFVCLAFEIFKNAVEIGNSRKMAETLRTTGREFKKIFDTSVIKFALSAGVLILFFILPFCVDNAWQQESKGVQESQKFQENREVREGGESLLLAWKEGVYEIAGFLAAGNLSDEEIDFNKALFRYAWFYIALVGIVFAIIRILFSIIDSTFSAKRESEGIVAEYSTSIGVMAVGVSLLWALSESTNDSTGNLNSLNPVQNRDNLFGIVEACVQSFTVVIIVIALSILCLEIVRLLMDMRERIIRKEAKYIFISIIGQAGLTLLEIFCALLRALNDAFGAMDDGSLEKIQRKIRERMIKTIENELVKNDEDKDDSGNSGYDEAFPRFASTRTRK